MRLSCSISSDCEAMCSLFLFNVELIYEFGVQEDLMEAKIERSFPATALNLQFYSLSGTIDYAFTIAWFLRMCNERSILLLLLSLTLAM